MLAKLAGQASLPILLANIAGEDGMLVFNDSMVGADKLLLFPHRLDRSADLPTFERAKSEPIPYADSEPLRLEMEEFLDAVRGERKPLSDAVEGTRVLRILDACHRSLIERRAIELQ